MSTPRDFKATIRLPKTDFPMKANFAQREPAMLQKLNEDRVYENLLELRKDAPRYSFHDGPPYANGNIHYGHIFNKICKDFVVKYQLLSGKLTRFVPGWDCHGLPIELNVERAIGKEKKAALSKAKLREICRKEAEKWIDVQRKEFQRLGCFGTWESPYLTMHPAVERGIIEALVAFIRHGIVYRGKKPVYWCGSCRTALAEAEVEYGPHTSPSVYVKFPFRHDDGAEVARRFGASEKDPVHAVIWTTTPWTLPANLAIAAHADFEYALVRPSGRAERWLLAKEMIGAVSKATRTELTIEGDLIKGSALAGLTPRHPFEDRGSPLLTADHVTLEAGTGLVHTAPGHGAEDYVLGREHGLEPFAPVDDGGHFTNEVKPEWRGMQIWEANPHIVKFLAESGVLANREGDSVDHSYAHCWRCKKPVLYRATTQWFIAMDQPMQAREDKKTLRQIALSEIDRIAARKPESGWIPAWGRDRIHGMIHDRPDWCISRQRAWGVPIPAFSCKSCETMHLTEPLALHVAEIFGKEGADAWYLKEARELLPPGFKCNCGGTEFEKDSNILDVWFESGSTFNSVLREENYGHGLQLPADLYLEGTDQHRGWFHSSLLVGCAVLGRAPYERVLTHGFVLDDRGRPYSKSEIRRRQEAGEKVEYLEPQKVLSEQGAELLRMWAAYEDYRSDMRYSREHLTQVADSYFKIRNTIRFLLGNLDGFDPKDVMPEENRDAIDRWAAARLRRYKEDVHRAYETYDFRSVFHRTVEICVGEWSSFYLDALKDRLYCDAADDPRRRSSQSTLYEIAEFTIAALAPLASFTCDEAWRLLPGKNGQSVFLGARISSAAMQPDDDLRLDAQKLFFTIRDEVNQSLEPLVKTKEIPHRREARVILSVPSSEREKLALLVSDLAEALAVAGVEVRESQTRSVDVRRTQATPCERCWRHRSDVQEGLCTRCKTVVSATPMPAPAP